jgi:TubC N-terminal docking domain
MTPRTEALARIQAAGIRLEVRNDKLTFQGPPDAMTPERTAWLTRHKSELIKLLRKPAASTAGERTAVLTCAEDPGDVTPEMVQAAIGWATLTSSRGPCVNCGEPVTWANGLRNSFGQLVHLTCPAPAPEGAARKPVGTCPACRFTVYRGNAVQTGGGVFMHPLCARTGR